MGGLFASLSSTNRDGTATQSNSRLYREGKLHIIDSGSPTHGCYQFNTQTTVT